ncbi:MAG TPA: four helix bundle protein [Candidatus Moranbacteria bacterium]|nr:four helix bundle protein [Candidatus Moranbacteria bacterium]
MTNDKFPMTNQAQKSNDKNKYDLSKRTSVFGSDVIVFVKNIRENNINKPIINQLVRSATSVGANYMEADCAESKKDFIHKIGICKKESKETTHWLHMLAVAEPEKAESCRKLWKEAHELTLIFSAIVKRKY